MKTEELADRFILALGELEGNREVADIVGLFDDNALLYSPIEIYGIKGHARFERFWQGYRDTFNDIATRFNRILVSNKTVVLEWLSKGHLASNGEPVAYAGVTILECDGRRISQFNTYYDTAQLFQRRELLPLEEEISDIAFRDLPEDYSDEDVA